MSASGGISITSWLEVLFSKTGRKIVAGDENVMMGRSVQSTLRTVIDADIVESKTVSV